ncbi:hypothetical protein CKF54_05110 [Psittacicella hinzii]|uniref:Uncharacterized protein n=1 Tax=Psittacicella hinzii TaxID=2028575 RepID=A0A3A1Y4R9_9GAMM|nr:hypothetical protein [Psittacicella hinzii]RIY32289.1 hypothetical protein CKF54_05110 [Psittacicella hinzii]
MHKIVASLLLGISATSVLATSAEERLHNLVTAHAQYTNVASEFTVKSLLGVYHGSTISFSQYQQLLLQNFYTPLEQQSSLEAFLQIRQACQAVKDDFGLDTLVEVDRKYLQICSKTEMIYQLSGGTDEFAKAYDTALSTGDFTNLPTYQYYEESEIFSRLKSKLEISVTKS